MNIDYDNPQNPLQKILSQDIKTKPKQTLLLQESIYRIF